MSNESSSDLDSRIAAIVESTVARMRDELLHRVQDTEARLRDITQRIGAAGPSPEFVEETPPAAAGDEAVSGLFEAVLAIDGGTSQQEVLAALLEGTGRFAGRSALFLTRSDSAHGWGSYGFDETAREIQEVVLSYADGPLAALAEGNGCVMLTADDCAELCGRMGVQAGEEGLLIPFVLRDRLAAAIYVDRQAGETPLGRQPLQLLAYIGAQAVEGLALRQRGETPTLRMATTGAGAPGVALWEGPPAEPEAAEPEAEIAPETVAAEEEAAAPAMAEPPVIEPPVIEPPVIEAPAIEAPAIEAPVTEPPAIEPRFAEPRFAEPAPAEPADVIAAPPPEEIIEEETLSGLPTEMPLEPEPLEAGDWTLPAVPLAEPEPEAAVAESAAELTMPADAPAEPATTALPEEPQPWEETAGTDLSSVETAPAPESPATEMMPPPAGPGVAETTEVRPPTDVSGPGWAFTASRAAAESGDDAQHEEARRLARLLVTEIKLYNEEQVEEGRRGNDIHARLREDIDRSRQIFNERVDEAVREETDYFHEEMVRILAGGNAEALGI